MARNGKIIEQEQILTTHNLAALVASLDLMPTLRPVLGELARNCFEWICRRHKQRSGHWKARLRMVKNTAYAWRQMIFFLALLPEDAVESFLGWAAEQLGKQSPEFQNRFRPALVGLTLAHSRQLPQEWDTEGGTKEARRFLGWTTEKHWMLS